MQNTGFLIWTSNCCIACINQKHSRLKHLFSLIVSYANSDSSAIKQTKHISGTKTLVETIRYVFNIQSRQSEIVEYNIQFISCSSIINSNKRNRIQRYHGT